MILLSLIGGYPVGAKMLAAKSAAGAAGSRTAERLLCFCVNCSPAFLIAGVGIPYFHSVEVGCVLWGSPGGSCSGHGAVGPVLLGVWRFRF